MLGKQQHHSYCSTLPVMLLYTSTITPYYLVGNRASHYCCSVWRVAHACPLDTYQARSMYPYLFIIIVQTPPLHHQRHLHHDRTTGRSTSIRSTALLPGKKAKTDLFFSALHTPKQRDKAYMHIQLYGRECCCCRSYVMFIYF